MLVSNYTWPYNEAMKENPRTIRCADLFAGIGGMRRGFEEHGFLTIYANDCDKRCKVTYEANFGEGTLDNREIQLVPSDEIPEVDIILAGFPCQPFSLVGKRLGFQDKRGNAFYELARVINDKKPKAILLENVQNIEVHNNRTTMEVIRDILENRLGYHMYYKVLNSRDFGLPQNRRRMYMVGFREDIPFVFPESPGEKLKLKDIMEKGEVEEKYYLSQRYLTGLEGHKERHNKKGHGFGFEILAPEQIANTLVVGNMGRERNLIIGKKLPDSYVLGADLSLKNDRGVRRLTVRECARLQGFPEEHTFPVPFTCAYKQLGNTVSVPVISAIAKQIRKALLETIEVTESEPYEKPGNARDRRTAYTAV